MKFRISPDLILPLSLSYTGWQLPKVRAELNRANLFKWYTRSGPSRVFWNPGMAIRAKQN
ncbi:hypothetical protein N7540_008861 [Penicillium herquei]|nr:hypothetical protein N7540_008861 [Penicillium herquei]